MRKWVFSSVSLLFSRMIDEGGWEREITILAKVGHRTREKKKERIRECRYSTREKERGREKKREVNDPMTRVVD